MYEKHCIFNNDVECVSCVEFEKVTYLRSENEYKREICLKKSF
jgi:ribosomal protein S26